MLSMTGKIMKGLFFSNSLRGIIRTDNVFCFNTKRVNVYQIDDQVDVVSVDSSCCQIGGDQDSALELF